MKIKDTDFAYIIGRIRYQELKLLQQNDLDRMLNASSADEAFQVLSQLKFSENLGANVKPADFQEVIDKTLLGIKQFLKKYTPHKWPMRVLWYRFDLHNLKTIIKAKLTDQSFEEVKPLLSDLSVTSSEEYSKAVYEGDLNAYIRMYNNDKIWGAIEKALEAKEFRDVDAILDKAVMENIAETALDTKNQFIIDFVQKEIDGLNVMMFARMTEEEKKTRMDEAFIKGGLLDREVFSSSEKLVAKLDRLIQYSRFIKPFLDADDGSHHKLEKERMDILTEHMHKARYIAFGIEPVFAYFWTAYLSARIIRMIMVGKLANVPVSEIRERLYKFN